MSASRSDEVRERQTALLEQARTAYEDGSYDRARKLIEQILALDPNTEEAAAAERLLRRIQRDLESTLSVPDSDDEPRRGVRSVDFGVEDRPQPVRGRRREDDDVREASVEPPAPAAPPPRQDLEAPPPPRSAPTEAIEDPAPHAAYGRRG